MTSETSFVPNREGHYCAECGSVLGRIDALEAEFCPSPLCSPDSTVEVDASYLYRGRALVFVPDAAGAAQGDDKIGSIRAVRPADIHDRLSRRASPVVVTGVMWPRDRKRFAELFEHQVHHESAPHVTPLNDGWDSTRNLPVL